MYATNLKCVRCGREYPLRVYYKCPSCGGILDVEYDYEKLKSEVDLKSIFEKNSYSLWKYFDLLPIHDRRNIVSLREGVTPLLKAEKIGEKLGMNLYVKDETRNPTSSFKDRPYTVGVSKAKELGIETTTVASSGNAAASLAAYSAKADMSCYVFISGNVLGNRVLEIQAYGATVIRVRGVPDGALKMSILASERFGWYNLTSTFLNPYTTEGDKTIAYELYEQLGFKVPDWILVPVGAGPLLVGCFKGFRELRKLGFIDSLPRMVAVQAEGCSPIVKAFVENRLEVEPWGEEVKTISSSIAGTLHENPDDGTYTLKIVRESRGYAAAVSDEETLKAVNLLAGKEGILAEPASATVIAASKKLVEDGVIDRGEIVVSLITGSGLKELKRIGEKLAEVYTIAPEIEELEKLIKVSKGDRASNRLSK